MIDEDAVTGVTSNPTIFQSAIAKGARLRRAAASELLGESDDPSRDLLRARGRRRRATRATCCGPVWDATDGQDGYVSLEVDPTLAHETDETLEQAIALHELVDRPNVYIKIPATIEGLPAIEDVDRARHLDQRHADLLARPLRRRRRGLPPRARAARRGRRRPVEGRLGRVVLRLAHRHRGRQAARRARQHRAPGQARRSRTRSSPTSTSRRRSPARAGTRSPRRARRVQRPLWASTSTKNPAYRDTLYVEELIGPDTVNTMPPGDVEAFQDHGEVRGDTVLEGRRRGRAAARRAAEAGVDYDDVVATLEVEGVEKFVEVVRRADRRHPREAGRAGRA